MLGRHAVPVRHVGAPSTSATGLRGLVGLSASESITWKTCTSGLDIAPLFLEVGLYPVVRSLILRENWS